VPSEQRTYAAMTHHMHTIPTPKLTFILTVGDSEHAPRTARAVVDLKCEDDRLLSISITSLAK